MSGIVEPDISLGDLLKELRTALGDQDVDVLIAEAVLRFDLLSWGCKGGHARQEMIPQAAWTGGALDHRAGTLVYRHPDSPLPEDYAALAFNRGNLAPWLRQLRSAR